LQNNEPVNTKINFNSEAFKKYFANTSWLFAERVTRLLVTFLVGVYIIRYLGPDQFGLLSYATSFVGLFSAFATLGLESILVRELVKTPEKRDTFLGSVFTLRIIGALTAIALIGVAVIISADDLFTIVLIFIIAASTIFQTFNVIDSYFQARVLAKYSVYMQSSSMVITSALKILLILFEYPLVYFAVVTTLESVVLSFGYVFVYKIQNLSIFKWRFNKEVAIQFLKDAWPLILAGLAIAIYMKIGQIMIKKMMSNEEVGYYAAAVRLCEAWYFIPMAITTSLYPAIVNAKKVSEVLYLNRLQKLYDIMAWISIGIAIPVTLFSELIIKILLGTQYLPAAPVLTIYIWAGVPTFLGVASSQFLITENLTLFSFYRTLLGMVLNVVLNFTLIPIWGIAGSAISTLVSYSLATISIGISRKTFSQLTMIFKSLLFINIFKLILKYGTNIKTKNKNDNKTNQ
jgi:O-antigen/teichoic acid export membrane protein